MTLLDKVKELQNVKPPLDADEINRRVQEWKNSNQPKVEAEEVKEVKIKAAPDPDANVAATQATASNTDSTLDSGSSVSLGYNPQNVESSTINDDLQLQGEKFWFGYGYSGRKLQHNILKEVIGNVENSSNFNVAEEEYYNNSSDDYFNLNFDHPDKGKQIIVNEDGSTKIDQPTYIGTNIVTDAWDNFSTAMGFLTGTTKYDPNEDTYKNHNSLYDAGGFTDTVVDFAKYGFNQDFGDSNKVQVVLNYSGEQVGTTTANDLLEINIPDGRERFIMEKTNIAINNALLKKDKTTLVDETIDAGEIFNSPEETELIKLQKKYKTMPKGDVGDETYKARKKVGERINELVSDLNIGSDKLYDEYTGNIYAYDKAPVEVIESYEASKEIAKTTEIDVLKNDLTTAYYKVVALAKMKIPTKEVFYDSMSRLEQLTDVDSDASRTMISGPKVMAKFDVTEDIRLLEEIAKTGVIPKKISKLPGEHPFAKSFNKALDDYIVINRAYQTNRNPVTSEKEGFMMTLTTDFLNRLAPSGKNLDGSPGPTSAQSSVVVMSDFMRDVGQIDLAPEVLNERMELSIPQLAGTGLIDLTVFAGEILATRKVTANKINDYYKTLQKLAQANSYYKGRGAFKTIGRFATQTVLKGTEEAVTFVVSENIWKNPTAEDNIATAKFAFSLGVGQGGVGHIFKALKTNKIFLPVTNSMVANRAIMQWPKSVLGAGTGAASFEFASMMQEQGAYFMKYNADGTMSRKSFIDHTKHFLGEYAKMRMMGAKSLFAKNGMLRAFENDIRAMAGYPTVELNKAGKAVGWKDMDGIKNPKENTLEDLNNAKTDKLEDAAALQESGKLNEKQAQDLIKKINENYELLEAEAELNIYKKEIKAEDNSNFKITDGQVYIAVNKLKKGEDLNAKDNFVLANAADPILRKYMGGGKSNQAFIDGQRERANIIEDILNNNPIFKSAFVKGAPSKTRQEAFDFLNKSFEVGGEMMRLRNQKMMTVPELERLKVLEEQHKQYNPGGELYIEITEKIRKENKKRFEEDLIEDEKFERPQKLVTSKDSFKKKYNELFPDKPRENIENQIAFFNPKTNTRYINEVAALEQGMTATATHERTHYAFVDAYKGKDGRITDKGIKIIDDVLGKLTPEQRKILDAEVLERYADLVETGDKGVWYEENLAVLAELTKEGRISFKQGSREKLRDLLNLEKSNLKVNLESGENIFEVVTEKDGLNRIEGLTREGGREGVDFSNAKANELANNTERTREENLDLQNQYVAIALEALGFKEALGTASRKEAVSFVNQYYPGILRRFKPGKTMFSTFVTANIRPKKQKFYEQEVGTKGVETRISDERLKEIAAEETKVIETEVKDDFKLVDNIKVNKQSLDVIFKDKVKEFVADQLKDLNVTDEKFRSEAFKPSKEFINYIKQNLLGKSITDYKNFIRENPNFTKGLNIKALIEFDKGRTKEGKPRLFTELNRRLTKQAEIEKFMMQGRVPYLTVKQMGQGANLYNRLKPTETAIVNFLTGGSASTISNRKTAVAREMANRFIKEATPSTEAFKEMTTAERAKIAEKLQVDPTAKFAASKGIMVDKNKILESKNLKPIPKGKEGVDVQKDFLRNQVADVVGAEVAILLAANSKVLANAGNRASGAIKAGFNFITDLARTLTKYGKKSEDYLDTVDLLNAGELGSVVELQKQLRQENKQGSYFKDSYNKLTSKQKKEYTSLESYTAEQTRLIKLALSHKSARRSVELNIKEIDEINKGKDIILDIYKKIYDANPKSLSSIADVTYHYNSNSNPFRDLATIIGETKGLKPGTRTWDEHMLQFGNYSNEFLFALTQSPKAWQSFKDMSNKIYYQLKLEKAESNILDGQGSEFKERFSKNKSWLKVDENGNPLTLERYNPKSELHPLQTLSFAEARKTGDYSKVIDPMIRAYNEYFFVNAFKVGRENITDAKRYLDNVEVSKTNQEKFNVQAKAASLIYEVIQTEAGFLTGTNAVTGKQGRERLESYIKIAPAVENAYFSNSKIFGKKLKDTKTVKEQIEILKNYDTAAEKARKLDAPVKKIRVFDFDDTLAKSKSRVLYEKLDGTTGKLTATEFARDSEKLESEGVVFDFSEFTKVIDGKKGPLFDLAKKIQDARGSEDIFVLTARPQESATAIKEFLDALGLKLPIENITGLSNGSPSAKANWIASKAAKGYNDFYFADDMMKNVTAVKAILDQIDVKGVVQQAKFSKAKTFDKIFNEIIESSTGIKTYKEFSAAKAKTIGEKKGKFTFFTTPSAEDFLGLLYKTLGKGKVGDAQYDFYKTNLIDTYNRAELNVTEAKITASRSFKALKSKLTTLPKSLSKQTGIGGFTFSQAVRVSVWSKQGMKIPGLSKTDVKELNKFVDDNAELTTFTNELINIQKGKPYPAPTREWLGGTITTDIISEINKVNRKEYLQEWQENVDILFSDKNLNKLEAAYGSRYREALEESLYRMKTGSNRPTGGSRIVNEMMDWLNNSVGAIMFLNTRSAVLQTISSINFINWENNNILKAGKAFANQPQYWKDFKTLMNSPYLLERREGLKINVSESEIADAVMQSKNKVTGAINYLLNKGFVFTRIADSFAIASGGATFYRNQIEAYVKNGMTRAAAEKQAYEDFYAIAETNQQSSNASKISQQQASAAGRVILAFGNTPMQYNRIIKKSTQDLVAGRGDWRANLTKIVYYAGMQNFIFNALQNAIFAEAFGEDEGDESDKTAERNGRIADGMTDSLLRGVGIQGAALSAVKDALVTIYKENSKEKGTPKYEKAIDDLLGFSPPISSKIRKVRGGLRTFSWNKKKIDKEGFNLNNPAYLASADIVEGFTNIPSGRAIKKMNNIRNIFSENSDSWQKVAMTMGWSAWDVGLPYYGLDGEGKEETPASSFENRIDELKKTTTGKQQKQTLLDLGLTRSELKKYKYEEDRVKKIIELQKKYKNNPKTKDSLVKVNERKTVIFSQNKSEQVNALLGLGLSKEDIKKLKYEKDRVDKIIELQNKK